MSRLSTKQRRARRWRRRFYASVATYLAFLEAADRAPPRTGKEVAGYALLKAKLHSTMSTLRWRGWS